MEHLPKSIIEEPPHSERDAGERRALIGLPRNLKTPASPMAKRLWAAVFMAGASFLGAKDSRVSAHSMDEVHDTAKVSPIRLEPIRSETPTTSAHHEQRTMPSVRGFGEYLHIDDERITRWMQRLPPALTEHVGDVHFLPKEIADTQGVQYYQVPGHHHVTGMRKHPSEFGAITLYHQQEGALTAPADVTIGLRAVVYSRDITSLSDAYFEADREVMIPRIYADLAHELTHSLGNQESEIRYYRDRVASGSRIPFSYTETFVRVARQGEVNWNGMASEYRSELARALFGEPISIRKEQTFEDAVVENIIEKYCDENQALESVVRADVQHMMHTVAPPDFDWIHFSKQGWVDMRQAEKQFETYRFEHQMIPRITNPLLRQTLERILHQDAEDRGMTRKIINSNESSPDEDLSVVRKLETVMNRRADEQLKDFSALLSRDPKHTDLLGIWRGIVKDCLNINDDEAGFFSRATERVAYNASADRFNAAWDQLSPEQQQQVVPLLVRVANEVNGHLPLPDGILSKAGTP